VIITHKEINYILANREKREFWLEVDFGAQRVSVRIEKDHAILDKSSTISLKEPIKSNFCYLVKKKKLLPIAFFSKRFNKFYKLLPTRDWPTVVIGSVPMHRITRSSPKEDTYKKINLLKPHGFILDTCMGLGYTAILASLAGKKVYTFEVDKNVIFLAKLNPRSRDLFKKNNIEIKIQDVSSYIKRFKGNYFDCIMHDPPTFRISPVLYSLCFYKQLYRVLKVKGRLFHYTPFYGIKRGINFPLRVRIKLKQAGFRILCFTPEKGGILCQK